jgi:DNA-directed RNA polymerase specialized sigma24 family protein
MSTEEGGRTRADDLTEMRARSHALFTALSDGDLPEDERSRLRDELVRLHLPLVEHFARRFLNRGEPYDDLLQVGTIGLIKAVDRFDLERGVEFSTYATPTIVGEIKRHFRDRRAHPGAGPLPHGRRAGPPGRRRAGGDHRGAGVVQRLLHAVARRARLRRRQRAEHDRRDRR